MGCGDEKLSKYLTQTFTAHCNAMICQQVTLSGDAEWPKVADAVIEAELWTRSISLPTVTPGAPKALALSRCPRARRPKRPSRGSTAQSSKAVPTRSTRPSRVTPVVNRADPAGKSHECETAALWGGRCWGGRRLQDARGAAQPHTTMGLRCRTAPHESLRLTTRITTLPRPDVARRRGGEERAPGTLCARMRPSTYPRR